MSSELSVIVPTHNRRDILLKVLPAYDSQTAADRIAEVIVVDDGSTDGTGEAASKPGLMQRLPLRYFRQECSGAAAARNRGLREARAGIVLFGDDDIVPAPAMVAEHLAWHDEHPAPRDAVLGRVAWSPEVRATPFMEWLAQDGVLTSYGRRRPGIQETGTFLSGNISLKKDFLLQNGTFDEDFRTYGFEDLELGRRLAKKGLRVFYNPDALGFHYKWMSVADVWHRAELVENSRRLFNAKTGEPPANRQRGPARATLRRAVRATLPALAPTIRLFDSQIPLPWTVYRLYYYHYMLPTVRGKLGIPEE